MEVLVYGQPVQTEGNHVPNPNDPHAEISLRGTIDMNPSFYQSSPGYKMTVTLEFCTIKCCIVLPPFTDELIIGLLVNTQHSLGAFRGQHRVRLSTNKAFHAFPARIVTIVGLEEPLMNDSPPVVEDLRVQYASFRFVAEWLKNNSTVKALSITNLPDSVDDVAATAMTILPGHKSIREVTWGGPICRRQIEANKRGWTVYPLLVAGFTRELVKNLSTYL